MPRHARSAPGGYAYHDLTRALLRLPLFQYNEHYRRVKRGPGPFSFRHGSQCFHSPHASSCPLRSRRLRLSCTPPVGGRQAVVGTQRETRKGKKGTRTVFLTARLAVLTISPCLVMPAPLPAVTPITTSLGRCCGCRSFNTTNTTEG